MFVAWHPPDRKARLGTRLASDMGGEGGKQEKKEGEVPFHRSVLCFRKRVAKSCKVSDCHTVFWCSGYTPYHVFCSWSKRASVRHLFFREISASRYKNFTDKFWDAAAKLCKDAIDIHNKKCQYCDSEAEDEDVFFFFVAHSLKVA